MEILSTKLDDHLQTLVEAGVPGIDILHGHLKLLMLKAEQDYLEAQQVEEETEEAMDSMERKYWEGYTDALSMLYGLTYDISFAANNVTDEVF